MRAILSKTLSFIFDAVDFNRDGDISKDEFSTYFKSLRINDDAIIQQVFRAMDTNNDETVNKQGINLIIISFFDLKSLFITKNNILFKNEEFETFGIDFFTSHNPDDPSKLFFGPLVN